MVHVSIALADNVL